MNFLAPRPEPNSSEAFHLFNARISLSEVKGPGDTTMRFSLWGKNLSDEDYVSWGLDLGPGLGLLQKIPTRGRTYGVEIRAYF